MTIRISIAVATAVMLCAGARSGPCEVDCAQATTLEGEPCGTSSNPGCDAVPPGPFRIMDCGEIMCGQLWADMGAQDTDWYELFVIDGDGDGEVELCITLTSELPATMMLYGSDCTALPLLAQTESSSCANGMVCVCVPATASYYIKIAPGTLVGGAILDGYPCGTPDLDYLLTTTCTEPCSPCGDPGAGPCNQANGTPGCDDAACCELVCQVDPLCCSVAWDAGCANLAGLKCDSAPCDVTCPAGAIVEGEPCGQNIVNAGCDAVPPIGPNFSKVKCGDVFCGQLWADAGAFDSDWFTLDIDNVDGSGLTNVCLQIETDLPIVIELLEGTCGSLALLDLFETDACTAVELCRCLTAPGKYKLRIYPGTIAGGPITSGFPCGATNLDYVLWVQCEPCPPGDGPCVTPPPDMVAWWTLDETVGPTAVDSVFGNDGTYLPNLATGPVPGPGLVGNALAFDGIDDFVEVPHASAHDFQCGAFSIDAWVRFDPNVPSPGGAIVTKIGGSFGYEFAMLGGGTPALVLLDTTFTRCIVQATSTVGSNVWTHVAVTVDAVSGGARDVTFYINGTPAGTFTTGCACLDNTGPLHIGNGLFQGLFEGALDEIELFDRVLTAAEVLGIYEAGEAGKCKQKCHVPWDEPFCEEDQSVIVGVEVCNCSPVTGMYQLAFAGLPVGPGCTIVGPTTFTVLGPNPVTVGPNDCETVLVEIDRPVGMTSVYDIGCYEVMLTNLATGFATACHGSVQDRRDLCATYEPGPGGGVIDLPVGTGVAQAVVIENTGDQQEIFTYFIEARGSEDMLPAEAISLNGLPPGEPVSGTLVLPPGAFAQVELEITAVEFVPFRFFDVIASSDVEADGVFEPLVSLGLKTVLAEASSPADLNGDDAVNGTDLGLMLGSWGECRAGVECPADLNGDEQVDGADLGSLLAAWTG